MSKYLASGDAGPAAKAHTDILYRAGNEHGHSVSGDRAAEIVASGGRIMVCAVDGNSTRAGHNIWGMQATVSGGSTLSVEAPRVSWPGTSSNSPRAARTHADVVSAAAQIAEDAEFGPNHFARVPIWVGERLAGRADELARYRAASRFHEGDIGIDGAWKHAVDNVLSGQGDAK